MHEELHMVAARGVEQARRAAFQESAGQRVDYVTRRAVTEVTASDAMATSRVRNVNKHCTEGGKFEHRNRTLAVAEGRAKLKGEGTAGEAEASEWQ